MATVRSGQVTVTTAGSAVQGTDTPGFLFSLVAHPDNADTVWVGNVSEDVAGTTGYPLQPQSNPVVLQLANLNELFFDADSDGDIICWLKLN